MKKQTRIIFLFFFVLLGVLFRVWSLDLFEYKYDQIYMFEQAQLVPGQEPWPVVGMKSGASLRNPPLSVWSFIVLGKIFGTNTPLALNTGVIVLNCFALILFGWMAFRQRDPKEKLIWLIAFAMSTVNPIQIRYDRIIWAQSILPIFSLIFLHAWMHRFNKAWIVIWGFLGAILGQLHMAGFFFAFSVFLWTLFFSKKKLSKTQWSFWVLGSVLGTLLMISWLEYVLGGSSHGATYHSFNLRFWSSWISSPLGIHIGEVIGSGNGLIEKNQEFYQYPLFFGNKTYLNGFAQWVSLLIGVILLLRGVVLFIRNKKGRFKFLLGAESDRATIVSSVAIGMGILLSLAGVFVYRHYLIVAYPLGYLFLSSLCFFTMKEKTAIRVALVLIVFQSVTAFSFHQYIDIHCGSPEGEFGVAYKCQKDQK